MEKIRQSGLWLVHHLHVESLNELGKERLVTAIAVTRDWVRRPD